MLDPCAPLVFFFRVGTKGGGARRRRRVGVDAGRTARRRGTEALAVVASTVAEIGVCGLVNDFLKSFLNSLRAGCVEGSDAPNGAATTAAGTADAIVLGKVGSNRLGGCWIVLGLFGGNSNAGKLVRGRFQNPTNAAASSIAGGGCCITNRSLILCGRFEERLWRRCAGRRMR